MSDDFPQEFLDLIQQIRGKRSKIVIKLNLGYANIARIG